MQRVIADPLFGIGKNAKYDFGQLMKLPIAAALEKRSIYDQSLLRGRVSDDDFYHHFSNKLKLESLQKLFRCHILQIKKMLKHRNLLHERIIIAIDKTEEHYWGGINNLFVTGGKRQASTNYAFRYLTAAIVINGQRFIIYVRALTKDDNDDAQLVEECLEEIRKLGFEVGTLLADREFYNGTILLLCNGRNVEYVIPAVKNEKFLRLADDLHKERQRFPCVIPDYDISGSQTCLVIYEEKNGEGKSEIFGFITNIDAYEISDDVEAIIELYKLRWGIENAHKYEDRFRISTNSTNGLIRFFFFMIGVIFHNVWVMLNLLAVSLGLPSLSLNVFVDILKRSQGIRGVQSYKHPQRQLWVKILLGKNTTKG